MAYIAKKQDGTSVYADEVRLHEMDEKFYCYKCGIPVKICSLTPSETDSRRPSPYFANKDRNVKHAEDCEFASSSNSEANYTSEGFVFEDFYNSCIQPAPIKNPSPKSTIHYVHSRVYDDFTLKTLASLYDFCKKHSLDTIISESEQKKISDIFSTSKNSHMRVRGVWGFQIVEGCYEYGYSIPYKPGKPQRHYIEISYPKYGKEKRPCRLYFSDKKLFKSLCKKIDEETGTVIVALGNWNSSKNKENIWISRCDVTSTKQIYFPTKTYYE